MGYGRSLVFILHRLLNLCCLFNFRLYTFLNLVLRRLKKETHVYAVSGGRNMKLDIYKPKSSNGPVPVIFFVHGGGWAIGTRRIIEPAFVRQVKRGYALVSISYSLSNKASWPVQIHEVKAALRWVQAHAHAHGLDPQRVVAAGGSAGAHLAIIAALSGPGELEGDLGEQGTSTEVRAVIAFYPPTDLMGIYAKGRLGRRSVTALLGGHPGKKSEALEQATPATHVRADAPPIYIVHGTIDHVVPYTHATALLQTVQSVGGDVELVTLPGVAHADWRFNSGKALAEVEGFLDQVSAK